MARTERSQKKKEEEKERTQMLALLETPKEIPDDGWDEQDENHREKITRDKRGRPTVMTKQVLRKLREAFMFGCTDREACIYAGIGERTFYDYIAVNPDFSQEKEELKENPVMLARGNIVKAINSGHLDISLEYLRRKRKKEFADQKTVEIEVAPVTTDDIENGEAEALAEPGENI